jgi:hypothetical protein
MMSMSDSVGTRQMQPVLGHVSQHCPLQHCFPEGQAHAPQAQDELQVCVPAQPPVVVQDCVSP